MPRRLSSTLVVLFCCLNAFGQKAVDRREAMQHLAAPAPAPIYPPLARQARIEGTVKLLLTINEQGKVINVEVESGHPMLKGAAEEAVKQWKFEPFLEYGEPTEVTAPVSVRFRLRRTPEEEEANFQSLFDARIRKARAALAAESLDEASAAAKNALDDATESNHHVAEAQAHLVLLLIAEAANEDPRPQAQEFDGAYQNALDAKQVTFQNEQMWNDYFEAGSCLFRVHDYKLARQLLIIPVVGLNEAELLNADGEKELAEAASMLAFSNLQGGSATAASQSCAIFRQHQQSLHGLEHDAAAARCEGIR